MRTLIFTPQARKDLKQAHAYVSRDSPQTADRLLERIAAVLDALAADLMGGPEVQLRDGRRVHRWSVPPYRIYYQKRDGILEVVRVYHGARRPIERA